MSTAERQWRLILDWRSIDTWVLGNMRAVQHRTQGGTWRWRAEVRLDHSWTPLRSNPYGPYKSRRIRVFGSAEAAMRAAEVAQ